MKDFRPPEDEHAKVWRFMSFAKYAWLLENQSLFFARATTFGDLFEGAKTRKTLEMRAKFNPRRPKHIRKLVGGSDLARDLTFISCWHLNEHESQGMWKLYVDGTEGVAVQSRFDTLDRCLRVEQRWALRVYLGCVKYIDYEEENLLDDFASPFTYKRLSFRHECEVRAIIFPKDRPKVPLPTEELQAGKSVKVDLNSLVEAVYTSPYAPPWFHHLVVSVSRKYGLVSPVKASELKAQPSF